MERKNGRIKLIIPIIICILGMCSCSSNSEEELKTTKRDVNETVQIQEETTAKVIIYDNYIVTTSDFLNVRKEPNTDSEVIDVLYKNTLVDLTTTDDNGWLMTKNGEYVSSEYVELSGTKRDTYAEYQIVEKYNDETHGIIFESSGNIRSLPDIDIGEVVATAPKGIAYITVGKCKNNWYMIKYGEGYFYISNEVFKTMTDEEYQLYIETPHKVEFDENKATLIGAYTTNYSPAASNRGYNVEKAATEIDCMVFNSGATFNWCRDMGPCGENEGYKSSTEISNDEYVTGYGGGICQVSSTICAAISTSGGNFEFVERHQHSKAQKYIPRELDATVSYPSTNFIIKNNNEFAVMFKSHFENGNVTVEVYKIQE